jgi:thiol-disulfide isomerase/thioredoxin
MKRSFSLGFAVALLAILGWFFLSDSGFNRIDSLTVKDLNDQEHTIGQGGKVLINFWATSCPSCVEEMPLLSQLHQEYKTQGFKVIAVAMSYDDPALISRFVAQRKLPFPVVFDRDGTIAQHFGDILLTPTNILINEQGRILYKKIGHPDPNKIRQAIE